MSAGDEYFTEPGPEEPGAGSPRELWWARVLLLVAGALVAIWLLIGLVSLHPTAVGVGAMALAVAPGIVGGVFAWKLPRSPWLAGWPLVTVLAVELAMAVADVGLGRVRGIVQLVLPLVTLVLLVRGRGRARPATDSGAVDAWWARNDGGASMIEYGALVVLVAVILSSLVSIGLQQTIGTDLRGEICRVFSGDGVHCRQVSAKRSSGHGSTNDHGTGNGRRSRGGGSSASRSGAACHGFLGCAWHDTLGQFGGIGKGAGRSLWQMDAGGAADSGGSRCHGFWGCAWHWTGGQISGFGEGVFKSLGQIGQGMTMLVTNPAQVGRGMIYAVNPAHWGQIYNTVFEGDAQKDWANGNYGEALGDVFTNTLATVCPGPDLLSVTGDVGKFGRVAEAAGKAGELGKVGDIAKLASKGDKAASRATKAARSGDVRGAQKAARDADRAAKQAERRARRDGCHIPAVALAPAGAPPITHLGRMSAPMTVPMEGCGKGEQKDINETEKKKREAHQAEREAEARHGKALAAEGQKILGRGHNPKKIAEWQEWRNNLSKRDKKLYDKHGGPRPSKKQTGGRHK